jgi:hypothetical protein
VIWRFNDALDDGRRLAPAAERNKEPILSVLTRVLPPRGTMLEIGSGTGQHVTHFAKTLSHLRWQPSDADPDLRQSIAQWIAHEHLANVEAPIALDIHAQPWPLATAAAIVCINVIHVAPWSATPALLGGAEGMLAPGAPLVLYGPFLQRGVPTSPGNVKFDADLKAANPAWGLREVERVAETAAQSGFTLDEVVAMPANNLTLVFRR